mmetsp:Transcript_9185/g.13667  ORF Transcript_9185/g.13667 Transcript_9185/m.13667 type:complete len:101 (-) Transcript_9185:1346-1648(-)
MIVASLCAIIKVVLFLLAVFIAPRICSSVELSKEEVASSKQSILGFLRMALAIATLCFSPPLSFIPLSPTLVSRLSGSFSISLSSWACCTAHSAILRVSL